MRLFDDDTPDAISPEWLRKRLPVHEARSDANLASAAVRGSVRRIPVPAALSLLALCARLLAR
jgi:hypothetical protein